MAGIMDKQNAKSNITTVPLTRVSKIPSRLPIARMVQNFLLIWLDANIDETNDDCRNSIARLRQVVNAVNKFNDVDKCVEFITDIKDEKAFLICSGPLGQRTMPLVHHMPQLTAIYIFCGNKKRHENWAKDWAKIKGVFTEINPICKALKQDAQECDQNSISMSFVQSNQRPREQNLDQLDASFMYSRILKEILLTIDFGQEHIIDFTKYCREQFVGNTAELTNIDKLEKEYRRHSPIWWYTYSCFLYPMINRALRTMEMDLIIKMGFFVSDLHRHITAVHSEQFSSSHHSESLLTVYRGQGLSVIDFEQLMKTKGGLISFNNFLSTSKNRSISLTFAERSIGSSDMMAILFVMTIDLSNSSTSFASICDVGAFASEEEILFSMHSVFRIGQIKKIDNNNRLWQVELTLTTDNDPQLEALTERIREETFPESTGWYRLGLLLFKTGQFEKAYQVYEVMLDQATHGNETAPIYQQLGSIKYNQGEYTEAITFYEKSLKIYQQRLLPNHPDLASSYNNIGAVYESMGDYPKALSSFEKALAIRQQSLPPNHPDLASSYNNIGAVYESMGDYFKALSSFEKALVIRQQSLPPNHPDLASSYNNIGGLYDSMGDYFKALSCLEKTLAINQQSLPSYHPNLAASHNNIGMLYNKMGEYSKALSYHKRGLEIYQQALPPNHPNLTITYNNIGLVYDNIGEYKEALSFHEKALEIRRETLPPNHPDIAISYNNIGLVYDKMGEGEKALLSHEKALDIYQTTLPPNHPTMGISYNNMGEVYFMMGDYSKALSLYERALAIQQSALPANHPHLQVIIKNIEKVKKQL